MRFTYHNTRSRTVTILHSRNIFYIAVSIWLCLGLPPRSSRRLAGMWRCFGRAECRERALKMFVSQYKADLKTRTAVRFSAPNATVDHEFSALLVGLGVFIYICYSRFLILMQNASKTITTKLNNIKQKDKRNIQPVLNAQL